MRRSIFWPAIEQFLDPDDGAGSGGTSTTGTSTGESGGNGGEQGEQSSGQQGESGGESKEPKDKTFTQDDVNKIVSDRLKDEAKKIAKQVREDIEREAKEAAAKEQGDYKTLYEKAQKDLETYEAEKRQRESDDLRKRICREAKLPEDMYLRLVGETEDELKTDAKALAKTFVVKDPPDGDQGKTRSKSVSTDPDYEAMKKPQAWNLGYKA